MFKTVFLTVLLLASMSMQAEYVVVDYDNHAALPGFKSRNPTHVAVLVANWCPDCIRNKAKIDGVEKLAQDLNYPVLRAWVGSSTEYRTPTNYLRNDPLYKLSGVPTLYLVKDNTIIASVINQEIYDDAKVQAFVDAVKSNQP